MYLGIFCFVRFLQREEVNVFFYFGYWLVIYIDELHVEEYFSINNYKPSY